MLDKRLRRPAEGLTALPGDHGPGGQRGLQRSGDHVCRVARGRDALRADGVGAALVDQGQVIGRVVPREGDVQGGEVFAEPAGQLAADVQPPGQDQWQPRQVLPR